VIHSNLLAGSIDVDAPDHDISMMMTMPQIVSSVFPTA
jgi:hypothetical protein